MRENNAVPQNVNFRCRMTYIKSSLRKLRTIYSLQKELQEKDYDEIFEDT